LIVNKKGMENSEQMLEISNKSEKIPENSEIKGEKKEEPTPVKEIAEAESEQKPAAKAKGRGRPKGSGDIKPRIKRIPIAAPVPMIEEVPMIPKPKVKAKKVIVQDEPEEEEEEQEEEVPMIAAPPEPEPVPKSPRTLRREHMQTVAQQKRAMAQARQDRFERVLDGFMGF